MKIVLTKEQLQDACVKLLASGFSQVEINSFVLRENYVDVVFKDGSITNQREVIIRSTAMGAHRAAEGRKK